MKDVPPKNPDLSTFAYKHAWILMEGFLRQDQGPLSPRPCNHQMARP